MQAQDKEGTGWHRIGFNVGYGNVNNLLFNDEDYAYVLRTFKGQAYYRIKEGKLDLELLFEPQINQARHELLNMYFVNPEDRERFMQERPINEYLISGGFLVRKTLFNTLEGYVLGSLGLGYIDEASERLAKGFTFVDQISLGISWGFMKNGYIDIRPSFRHMSNANLKRPNSGYNSLNIEFGIAFDIN
ncbi:acyloxyacyl hydrolase [Croceiramulus getboli]|nr:acyloxyacyl hydrolase [Flavobacteriaceae bacterium YJPT1-3]